MSDSHLVRFSAPVNAYLSFDSRSKVFQTSFLFCSLRESQWVLFYSLKNSRERKILDSKNYRYMYICIYLNLRCRSFTVIIPRRIERILQKNLPHRITLPVQYRNSKTAENSKIRIFISLFFRSIILASTRRSKRLVEGQSVRHRRYPPRRWRSVSVLTIVAS